MKYYIPQEKLNPIIDKMVVSLYGQELKMTKDKEGVFLYFHYHTSETNADVPFFRNLGKTLWCTDLRLPKMISNFFSMSPEESMVVVKWYFSTKYNIPIERVYDETYSDWFDNSVWS